MSVRILNCSTSIQNYYLCISEQVAGFMNRGAQPGDIVYLAVKVGKKNLCGARFVLDEPTERRPWADAENYIHCLSIKNIEYCIPFDLSILAQVEAKFWTLKFVQRSKAIHDEKAIQLLEIEFAKQPAKQLVVFELPTSNAINPIDKEINEEYTIEDEQELGEVKQAVPDIEVSIMGTFQTIHFSNETDKIKGLEVLANKNFYSLFPQFLKRKTVLIPENRIFKTGGVTVDGNNVGGIRSIPDGLLIGFDSKLKNPFQINLIEYECYGERKTRDSDKSNYLNSNIIPQLMRFASSFSIITDNKTRETTIRTWADKIIEFISADEQEYNKVISWVKELNPAIKERAIEREIEKFLIEAFDTNLRVLLIIDELSAEQKSTIKNVISSFKLRNGENIQFAAYVVRLVQKINITNNDSEFALTIQ